MKTKYAIGTYNPDGTPKKSKRKNMTYKGKPTKYQEKKMRNKDLLFLIVIWIVSIPCVAIGQFTNNFTIDDSMDVQEAPVEIVDDKGGAGSIEVIDFVKTPAPKLSVEQTVRETTMYNAGDPNQCDDTPCISASGDNICNLLAKGVKICAANFVPLGTKLEIQNYGECVVLDRMNSRFKNRVDIAAEAHEKPRAIKFGLQHLPIKVIK